MSKWTVASFFAGVGGIDLGFEQTGKFKVVYANEIDPYPVATYEMNFNVKVDCRDINSVKGSDIPDFDVMVGGFPCQAFSLAGYRHGFKDEKGRGNLFFQLTRIIREKAEIGKAPRICFFENVKNLVSHDNGHTFKVICDALYSLGYKIEQRVMNACEYGNVPQNRERIYIVAFRDDADYDKFKMPLPLELTKIIKDVIDFDAVVDDKYYYTKEGCYFYDHLVSSVLNKNTIYQWRRVYVRENKSNLVPTLTANMGTGGHNVPIILTDDGKYRKITPRECFNIQGFPKNYKLGNLSNTRLYKQAGNSVVVPVINRIAKQILKAIGEKP